MPFWPYTKVFNGRKDLKKPVTPAKLTLIDMGLPFLIGLSRLTAYFTTLPVPKLTLLYLRTALTISMKESFSLKLSYLPCSRSYSEFLDSFLV